MAHGEIEMQLWEYIDGACTVAEQERISVLIATDNLWQEKYALLVQLHTDMINGMELEQPSLRFSKNLMEAISEVKVARAAKQYVNLYIIRGIAAFFLLSIASALIFAVKATNWSSPSPSLVHINFTSLFSNSFFNMVIGINIILGLLLVDILLRRKRASRSC